MKRYHVHACLNGITVFVKDGRQRKMMRHLAVRAPRTLREHSEIARHFATKSSIYHKNVVKGSEHRRDGLPRYFAWGYWQEKTKCQTRTALSNSRTKRRIVLQVLPNVWKLQKRNDPFCLPSSLFMKHGAYSATHKQKTKRKVERHKLACLEEASCPDFGRGLIAISHCWGVVHKKSVPQSQTINLDVYKGPLQLLHESIRRHRPEYSASWIWLLVHDNARPHMILFFKDFLSLHQITVLPHEPYSPDLSPCHFFSFPLLKGALRGYWCAYIQAI